MTGFEAYKIYKSVFLHFTYKPWSSKRIKSFKMNVKCKESTYRKMHEFTIFEGASVMFSDKDWFRYVVANAMYGFSDCIYDFDIGHTNLQIWEYRRSHMKEIVWKDLETIKPAMSGAMFFQKNCLSLIRLLAKDQIAIETVSLINMVIDIVSEVRKSSQYSTILEPLLFRIERSSTFMNSVPEDLSIKFQSLFS